MVNPITALLGRTNPVMQMLSQMIGMAKASKDPMGALQQMSANNPQMQQVMQIVQQNIQQNGGDARTAFNNIAPIAQQHGIDPNAVLEQLKGLGL